MAFSSQFPHKVVLAARSIKPGFVIQKSLLIFSFQTMQKFRVFHFYLRLDWGHTIRNNDFWEKLMGFLDLVSLPFCIYLFSRNYHFQTHYENRAMLYMRWNHKMLSKSLCWEILPAIVDDHRNIKLKCPELLIS